MYPSEQQTQQTSIANRSAEVIQSSLLLKRDGKAVSKGNGFLSIDRIRKRNRSNYCKSYSTAMTA